jgi:tRNA-specific 2-thiouridylase
MSANNKKVFVGMSGGVDSSVAAFLLLKQGYNVTGVHIRGYNVDGCAEGDAQMARRAAEHLGIPFYVWDMEREYKEAVVDYMVSSYKNGITPNPDVMCNKEIKFGLFLDKAVQLGADCIATGHYAVLDKNRNGYILRSATDDSKDQTYFLWTLGQAELSKAVFPLGELLKSEVRVIASKAGLPNSERKDSQGICFLGKLSMPEFLSRYISGKPGPIMTVDGEKIGEHKGLPFYTLGQRHLGIEGMGGREPLYVARKDEDNNVLTVAPGNHPSLFSDKVFLNEVNIVRPDKINEREIFVRVRYRQPLIAAKLIIGKKGEAEITFDKPCKFVAPGQSAVFYSSVGEMIGGGVIV